MIGTQPGLIMTNMDREEIIGILEESFRSVRYARGLNNHQGSLATASPKVMSVVLEYLGSHGYFFVDSYTTGESVGHSLAAATGVPYQRRHVFLDNEDSEEYVQGQLDELVRKALENGSAVGIGHMTREATIDVLYKNVEKMRQEGIELVPVRRLLLEGQTGVN